MTEGNRIKNLKDSVILNVPGYLSVLYSAIIRRSYPLSKLSFYRVTSNSLQRIICSTTHVHSISLGNQREMNIAVVAPWTSSLQICACIFTSQNILCIERVLAVSNHFSACCCRTPPCVFLKRYSRERFWWSRSRKFIRFFYCKFILGIRVWLTLRWDWSQLYGLYCASHCRKTVL